MRRLIVVLVALSVCTSLVATAAATVRVTGHTNLERQFAIGVTGGLAEPHGQIGNEPLWTPSARTSGLDLRYGWNGSAFADFYMTSFLTAGLWYGQSDMRMRPAQLPVAGGTETAYGLVLGKTSLVGLHVKGFLPTERSWTPYAFVGVARYFRTAELSRGLLAVAPATDVFKVTDDCIGYDGGVGVEQPLSPALSVTANATYFYSGELKHDLQWMGRDMHVNSWEYWSVDLGLTWHIGVGPSGD